MIKIKCFNCGKGIKVFPFELRRNKQYCSRKCYNKKRYTHRIINKLGYILIYVPYHPHAKGKMYLYEHRLIMEKYLNRLLKKGECIHHIDGNPQNNKLKNLLLTTQSKHMKLHNKK